MALHRMATERSYGGPGVMCVCDCGWSTTAADSDAAMGATRAHLDQAAQARDKAETRLAEEIADPDTRTEL